MPSENSVSLVSSTGGTALKSLTPTSSHLANGRVVVASVIKGERACGDQTPDMCLMERRSYKESSMVTDSRN